MSKRIYLPLLLAAGLYTTSNAVDCKNLKPSDVKRNVQEKLGVRGIESAREIEGGFFELIVKSGGKKIPVYVDCNMKYLITGQLIDLDKKKNITRERVAQLEMEVSKEKEKELVSKLGKEKYGKLKKNFPGRINNFSVVDLKNLPNKGIVVFGNKNSNKVVYVVTDPECPYCARLHKSLEEVLKRRKDVQFKILFYPLSFHRHAKELASAVVCSNNSSEVLTTIFKTQRNPSSVKKFSLLKCEEGDKIVENHVKFGESIGVRGTPTIILSNGLMTSGALGPDDLEKLIDLLD